MVDLRARTGGPQPPAPRAAPAAGRKRAGRIRDYRLPTSESISWKMR
jgi:hypothetical protein